MKKILLSVLAIAFFSMFANAQDISTARAASTGDVVTISGIVTNGAELGSIRYIQDATAGIAIYAPSGNILLENVVLGDDITVTGEVAEYNQLLEVIPTEITVNSSGNDLPDFQVVTPAQINEDYEGELVKVEAATFTETGVFAGGTNYEITANSETIPARVNYEDNGTTLVGVTIPTGEAVVMGVVGQYHADDPAAGYQILLRHSEDVVSSSSAINEVTSTVGVYPNPTTDAITVTSQANIATVEVISITGQKIITQTGINNTECEVNVAELANGVYFVSMTDVNGNVSTSKIVKK